MFEKKCPTCGDEMIMSGSSDDPDYVHFECPFCGHIVRELFDADEKNSFEEFGGF
jgi:predicted RNA-binding Zn-ribbon protein involved in translation (DUF1610 family)